MCLRDVIRHEIVDDDDPDKHASGIGASPCSDDVGGGAVEVSSCCGCVQR